MQQQLVSASAPRASRFAPPRAPPVAVERIRLLDRIDQSDAPLTLICAPAGFGKTTLMQQLLGRFRSGGMTAVWLQVTPADNELGHLLRSVIGALQSALPRFLAPEILRRDHRGGSAHGLAADLLDRIALSDAAVALLLDDLELITDPDACGFLQRLLADLGPNHRVVIGSRTPPPLALGRLRAHGLILELGQADLRFTQDESTSYLQRQGMAESAALQSLQQRTEGWPVALQLAAITLNITGRRSADWLEHFSGSTDSVAEYLAQEVLDSRPPAQRDFLLRSSVLSEFCPELCDAVLQRQDSAEMIAQTLRSNLPLSSVDADQGWYRYHPLFADFLRRRLRLEAARDVPDLHRRAARWASSHRLINEAVTHALAAEDGSLAADLLANVAMDMVRSGRVADTARAIELLPEAEVARRPSLLRAGAFAAVFAHRYDKAARLIETIERADGIEGSQDEELVAMRLMLLGWTDRIPEMLAAVASMRSVAGRFSPFTAGLASNASAFCNIALHRYTDAERDLALTRQACEPIGALYVLSYAACFAAAIRLVHGECAAARALLESALGRTIAEGQRYGSAGAVVATHLAEVLYETDELDACAALVGDYLPIVVETGLPDHLIVLHRIAARLALQRGQADAAEARLAELDAIGARRGIRRLSSAAWLERAYIALRRDEAERALRAFELGNDVALWRGFGEFQPLASEIEDPLIAELRLRLALGQGAPMLSRLETAMQAADATDRRRRALRLGFLRAQILEAAGRVQEAGIALDAVLARTAGSGLARTLTDDAWAAASLVARAQVAGETPTAALLGKLAPSDDGAAQAREAPAPRNVPGISRLTAREVQVLRLLWKGHSNKAVARELFLSENTVETHLRRIYEKLGTRNRTQAATLAREAGAI